MAELRDEIAIAAMTEFLRHAMAIEDGYAPAVVAAQAYRLADAMLIERLAAGSLLPAAQGKVGHGYTLMPACLNGFRSHRWDLNTLTCFRCRKDAPIEVRSRARKLFRISA